MAGDGSKASWFAPTRWTVVLEAAQESSPAAAEALAALCQTYWYPLYVYVRRRGYSRHDAEDLTQEFFSRLLQKRYLVGITRAGGRFRSFLLTAMQRFLANEWDRAKTVKRGGRERIISLEAGLAESQYHLEPAHHLTPDKLYDQKWAQTVLDQVLARLREEYRAARRSELFEEISASLSQPRGAVPYAEIAARLRTSEAAIKMAAQRLRRRYRELLRAEVAQTVASLDEVEQELHYLFSTFTG